MSVNIEVRYHGNLRCTAKHGPSGNTLETDAPVDNGGKGEAFSPTDLVATGLGTCVMTILGILARREGIELAGAQAHVIKEMTASPVRRIGSLTVSVTIPNGKTIPIEDRGKLERAATACPVKQSLHPDVNVRIEFAYVD